MDPLSTPPTPSEHKPSESSQSSPESSLVQKALRTAIEARDDAARQDKILGELRRCLDEQEQELSRQKLAAEEKAR